MLVSSSLMCITSTSQGFELIKEKAEIKWHNGCHETDLQ